MNRSEILTQANRAVSVDRAATHGDARKGFTRIAAIWSIRFGVTIRPEQVALALIDVKAERAWFNPGHVDNWVDIGGYGSLGGEIATDTNTPTEGLPFDVVKAERDVAIAATEWRPCDCANDAIRCTCPQTTEIAPPEGQVVSGLGGVAK